MTGILVLEGPDCAGKTTLAKAIMKIDPAARYIHMTYRFKDRMGLYHAAAINRAIQYVILGHNVIIDRWWPSTEIYSQVMRQDNRWNNLGRRLNPLLHRYGFICLCLPDFHDVLERHLARISEEMYQNIEDVVRIYEAYFELAYGNKDCKLGGLTGNLTRKGGVLFKDNWEVVNPFQNELLPGVLLTKLKTFRSYDHG